MTPDAPQLSIRPNSVNLFITNLCNRRCPFCYLKDWITNDEKKAHHMSLKNLRTLIRWLKRSKIYNVQLAGGEPMLHPNLLDFVNELVKNNISIYGILTNGLGETELYKEVADITGTNWLINITNPKTYTNAKWELLNRNLDLLRWKNEDKSVKLYGFDTTSLTHLFLSITYYKPDQDYSYIIELAKKYECPVIRYDVSRPACDKSNIYIDFDHLVAIKPTLMDFVKRCVREGIKPGQDDALPFCIFTQKELMFLNLFSNFHPVCIPHLDVMPDLTVEYCTSMRGIMPSYKVQDMTADKMFYELFYKANRYRKHQLTRCNNCYNYERDLCQGYCLRFKVDLMKKTETKRRSRVRWPKFLRSNA